MFMFGCVGSVEDVRQVARIGKVRGDQRAAQVHVIVHKTGEYGTSNGIQLISPR
jgi:hypothetical protein